MIQDVQQEHIARRVQDLTQLYGTAPVSSAMGLSTRTIERWAAGQVRIPLHVAPALDRIFGSTERTPQPSRTGQLTFVDLFAGIGGIRLGLEAAGAACVFTSEWDKYAVQTYAANHMSDHAIAGDITQVDPSDVPDHDILAAGFPCQPFSLAGVSKKNSLGRAHGFLDATQGTLFFNVAEIVAAKRPRAVLLENVKNLRSHDGGQTFRVIREVLEDGLGYRFTSKVIDAKGFVPQHRERVIMVATRDGEEFDWSSVRPTKTNAQLESVLHREDGSERGHAPYVDPETGLVSEKYSLSDRLWAYLQAYAAKHKAAGNGFGYGLVTAKDHARTLSARYHKDGSEILISRGPALNPRRLTPRECARLMGFPDDFVIPVSDTQAYRQFGNSVAVPVIASVSRQLVHSLNR